MLKQYNVRLDPTVVRELDRLEGCRSEHIRNAVTLYIHNDMCCDTPSSGGSRDAVSMDYIEELKRDKEILQQRLDYFMLPWYHRLLLPQPRSSQ